MQYILLAFMTLTVPGTLFSLLVVLQRNGLGAGVYNDGSGKLGIGVHATFGDAAGAGPSMHGGTTVQAQLGGADANFSAKGWDGWDRDHRKRLGEELSCWSKKR